MKKFKKIKFLFLILVIVTSFVFITKNKVFHVKAEENFVSGYVFDKRCNKGYGLPKKDVESENNKIKDFDLQIQNLNNNLINSQNNLNKLLLKKKLSKEEKNQINVLQKTVADLKFQVFQLEKLKSKAYDPNLKNKCILVDSSQVEYNYFESELSQSSNYLIVNDETKIIVAQKNQDKNVNPREFIKYFLLGLINKKIKEGNLSFEFKVKVPENIIEFQSNENYNIIGLMPKKEYDLKDLLNLVKYKNYDDVVYTLSQVLFGSSKNTVDKLNDFLKNDVGLKNTHIKDIFDLNKKNLSTVEDILKFKYFCQDNQYDILTNVSYETRLTSLSKIKSIKQENTMMDPKGNWYYSDVNEYFVSSNNNSNVSGLFSISKLNQKYSVVIMNTPNVDVLYASATKLMKNAINYKYSNILLARNDDAKIDKLFESLNIERNIKVKHAQVEDAKIRAYLSTSISANVVEDYFKYLDVSIKYNDNVLKAPIKKGQIIGKIIFKDNKYQKIATFDKKHEFSIDLVSKEDVNRKNVLEEFFQAIGTFFNKWINGTSRINN